MKLEKFPVVTNRQEYKVTVVEKEDSLFGKYLVSNVYTLGRSKIFKKDKWILINKYYVDRKYEAYIGRYVELAKTAVKDYEDWLEEQERKENARSNGINEWNNWDGKVN